MDDAFALVLHSHLPYVRGAGRWPHGEEWIHEAILGTYLPLLVVLHDLRDERVRYRVTIGLTPTLLEQLADRDVNVRFLEYIDDQVRRAELDAWDLASADTDRAALAEYYRASYARLRDAYRVRFSGDIVGAFADLARSGEVEILTSAATHGYLPLLDEASVAAQLAVGRATTERLTGLVPTGIWLPECAYRPGLERTLEAQGITHFFTDADLLLGRGVTRSPRRFGTSVPIRSGGSASEARLPADELDDSASAVTTADVLRPYLVADASVAAIARHPAMSGQVWSAATGYPGDPAYREFHRKDDRSGLRYWSVTATTVELGAKAPYRVADAAARARAHAAHFSAGVRRTLDEHRAATGRPGLLTTTFDSELFGHWWFEGVGWLGLVLRDLGPITQTAAGWLASDPPRERVPLAEGSWGTGNDHSTWDNPGTAWMWDGIREAAAAVGSLQSAAGLRPNGVRARAADQALRELLLLESSDWPFLVTTGQAADYGAERFRAHAERLHRCVELAQRASASDAAEIAELERTDAVFPDARLAELGRGSG
ncbi:MAG TPA: 1,4-alpha-glucan branching protein domain-containing protein [Candidatus Saccharimonadales bacterium]|nr:1,4-alpha-glucan branching protein domain-containing protein [Candidatus Saccharimonadales bacterium]